MSIWRCSIDCARLWAALTVLVALQILREKLSECYATHGVNHYEMCKDIKLKYMESTKVRSPSCARHLPVCLATARAPMPAPHLA